MFCRKCGKELDESVTVCPQCLTSTEIAKEKDSNSKVWFILGFLYPVVGLVLYLVWRHSMPRKAYLAGKGALIGTVVSTVISVVIPSVIYGIYGGTVLALLAGI